MLKRGILTASNWDPEGIVTGLLLQAEGEGDYPLSLDAETECLIAHQKSLIEAQLSELKSVSGSTFKVLSFNILKDFNQGD